MASIERKGWGVLVGLLLGLLAATAASAQGDFLISAGRTGGNYDFIAGRIQTVLITQLRENAMIAESEGSIENLERLADPANPVNVALAQADALAVYLHEHPDFAGSFSVLSDIGNECVFLVTSRNAGITSAVDLKASAGRAISVVAPASGAALTYRLMSHVDGEYGNTRTVYVDAMEVLAKLKASPDSTEVQGLMLVQRPRIVSPPLEVVFNNFEAYRFVPIRPSDLDSPTLPNGRPVYSFKPVTMRKQTFDTMCTDGLVLASKTKLSTDQLGTLTTMFVEFSETITPSRAR